MSTEQALVFVCQGEALVGVVSLASDGHAVPSNTAVLVIVGGPQYRVGSHRQYVQLTRYLAAQGVPAMRFDVRGMGDSPGAQLSFEDINDDIAAAIAALQAALPGVHRVALWGLCGGASAALLYWRATRDARVQGMVLVNPWVRSDVSLARTQVKHYYLKRVMERSFWLKLLRGGVAGKALGDLGHNLRLAAQKKAPGAAAAAKALVPDDASLQERMADGWAQFAGPTLLILSGNDYTAKEFLETASGDARWQKNLAQAGVTRLDLADADHTFSQFAAQRHVEEATARWLFSWARTS